MTRNKLVELKIEFNNYVKAVKYCNDLLNAQKYGSMEWANTLQMLERVEREKRNLETKLNGVM